MPGEEEPPAAINKQDYVEWEREVITKYFKPEPKDTKLMPTNGSPSCLKKEKVLLVALKADDCPTRLAMTCPAALFCLARSCSGRRRIEQRVAAAAASASDDVPKKISIQLYHFGKKKLDAVSYGLADGVFKHPACDIGGLTNYPQKVGEPAEFIAEEFFIEREGCDCVRGRSLLKKSKMIFDCWEKASKKKFPHELEEDLAKWLGSVREALGAFRVCFHQLPAEHRVVVTAAQVREETGHYYVRNYGGGEARHAVETSGADLADMFCAVSKNYITANINVRNINYEYSTYAEEDDKPLEETQVVRATDPAKAPGAARSAW